MDGLGLVEQGMAGMEWRDTEWQVRPGEVWSGGVRYGRHGEQQHWRKYESRRIKIGIGRIGKS